jgi:hypothetical protein
MINLLFAAALAAQPADAPPAPAASLTSAPPSEGVTDYPLAFFVGGNPSNAFDMIGRVPGFTFEGGDVVRGFASAAGNVLIDGKRPTSKASTLMEALQRIPAESVVRIELIRGGAPGIDMQGRSVLANVIRSKAAVTDSSVILQEKSFPDGHVVPRGEFQLTQRKGGLVWSVGLLGFSELDNTMGDGIQSRRDRTGAIFESGALDIDSKQGTYQGTFEGELTRANDVIRLNAALKRNTQNYDETVRVDNNVGRRISTDQSIFDYKADKAEIGGDYTRTLPAKLTLRVLGLQTYTKDRRDGVSSQRGSNTLVLETGEAGESIGRVTLTQARSARLTLEAGGEAAFNFLDASSARTANGVIQVLPNANVRVEEKRAEGFAKASFRFNPKLSAEVEARAEASKITQTGDTNNGRSFFFPKPRLQVTYKATPSLEIRTRFEREVGQLNFKDFAASSALDAGTVNVGNANLRPERAWVAEATIDKRFWGRGAVVVTWTHGWIQDAVDVIPINGAFDAPGNIGDGRRDALFASITVPLQRVGVPGGLFRIYNTWRWSKVTDPVTQQGRRISAEPPSFWQFRFSQDLPKRNMVWGVDGNMRMQDTSYRINEVRSNIKREFLILYTEWKPRPDITIRTELTNPTNRQRLRYRQQYVGPRSANILAYDERRTWTYGPTFALRARKTF